MSLKHPIIALTGSSGAGSSIATKVFEYIFRRERVKAVYIQGSAFHRYERKQMLQEVRKAEKEGRVLSHYGPDANHLDKLENLFFEYAAIGKGKSRYYLHSSEVAEKWGQEAGTLTPWKELPKNSDLLVYRGLHGAAIYNDIDISQYPDLLIGIVPNINLEWIRKIKRDCALRGYTEQEIQQSIIDRMEDYVHHITPQFSRTHVNFQMIPLVDTSNPFTMRDIPAREECHLIIHFQNIETPDFEKYLKIIPKSFMSNSKSIVVPGSQMAYSFEVMMMPIIHELIDKSRAIRKVHKKPKKKKSGLLGTLSQSG